MNFETRVVDKLSEVAAFASWLSDASRGGSTIAVAVRDRTRRIALADRDKCWVLDFKSEVGPITAGIFRTQLIERENLQLAFRSITSGVVDLVHLFCNLLSAPLSEIWPAVSNATVGDLTAAAKCINQSVTPMGKFRQIEQDAYEVALLLPQYTHGIIPFYERVGVPMAKMAAETMLFKRKGDFKTWWVSYDDLWLRVLAYYSGDPTLGFAFHEQRDPVGAASIILKCPDNRTTEALLLWMACGKDTDGFLRRFPNAPLPDDILVWEERIKKSMPSIDYMVSQMQRAYWESRSAETLFKRKLRPGSSLGDAVAFRIFGTVEDIVGVACVTFWNNRPSRDILVTEWGQGPTDPNIRIGGVGPKGETATWEWTQILKSLSSLGSPLGQLSLNPIVVNP